MKREAEKGKTKTMKIDHAALYAQDLEAMKEFFETWFGCTSTDLYRNLKTGFSSRFLSFSEGSRLEIMHRDDITRKPFPEQLGLVHLCLSVGSKEQVDEMAAKLAKAGHPVLSGPRTTGVGYYEAQIQGPEHLILELTV